MKNIQVADPRKPLKVTPAEAQENLRKALEASARLREWLTDNPRPVAR